MLSGDLPAKGRQRLAVALTFPVTPATGGGQVRALNLSRELSAAYDVELVSLVGPGETGRRRRLAPALWETRVPKSAEHASAELRLERDAGTVVTDIAMTELYHLTPDYLEALRRAAHGARAVVASHPYPLAAIQAVSDVPLWYDAHNVEAELKSHVLGDSAEARRLLARVETVERDCCTAAEFIWACSAEDRLDLLERYGAAPDRVLIVPNGVATDEAAFVDPDERLRRRERLRTAERLQALFIASWHEPNIVAARAILSLARQRPEIDFTILGSVGDALSADPRPVNVDLTGTVELAFKQEALGVASVALNPVTSGSGTNLKMLDYFAAGVPVVSSGFGARGLGLTAGEHYLSAEPPALGRVLDGLSRDPRRYVEMVSAARHHTVMRMSWQLIGRDLMCALTGQGSAVAGAPVTT